MTQRGDIPPPPGWHPDPYRVSAWRWWDGSVWTGHTAGPASPPYDPYAQFGPYGQYSQYAGGPGAPVALTTTPEASLSAEVAAAPWAERAFVWYLVVIAMQLLLAWAERSSVRQIFHDIRIQGSTGVVPPQLQQTTTRLDLLSPLALVVSAPFYVGVLAWQYRAARTARLLWLPAAHSAGLGVGSWFIPIVNFWFPYQSLRDCLPPGHPGRTGVGRLWACFLSVLVLSVGAEGLAWAGSPVGFAFGGAALVAGGGFAVYGVRTVRAIVASHRELLGPVASGPRLS